MTYNTWIQELIKETPISLVGFADLSELDSEIRQGLRYGICLATPLQAFPSMSETPSTAYYEEYKKLNTILKEVSFFLEEQIQKQGFSAYSLARNRQNEDFRTVLPFKTLATRAGLGWIGKSALLVTKEYGSAIRLNGVITDMPFSTAKPINRSSCGTCTECVDLCPAHAIVGDNWDIGNDRNDLIDPFACKNKVIERGRELGVTVGSCGICISTCPWTQAYIQRRKK